MLSKLDVLGGCVPAGRFRAAVRAAADSTPTRSLTEFLAWIMSVIKRQTAMFWLLHIELVCAYIFSDFHGVLCVSELSEAIAAALICEFALCYRRALHTG